MRKRSDTDPAPRGPESKPEVRDAKTQPGAREPEVRPDAMTPEPAARDAEAQPGARYAEAQPGAREPEVRPDAMTPEPAARDAEAQPGARYAEAQPGAIREQAEEGRGGRGRREVCYLRRHAWAVGRLLCGAGALAVLGTLRGEVPLLFALLALWGAGELLYGALRRRE